MAELLEDVAGGQRGAIDEAAPDRGSSWGGGRDFENRDPCSPILQNVTVPQRGIRKWGSCKKRKTIIVC